MLLSRHVLLTAALLSGLAGAASAQGVPTPFPPLPAVDGLSPVPGTPVPGTPLPGTPLPGSAVPLTPVPASPGPASPVPGMTTSPLPGTTLDDGSLATPYSEGSVPGSGLPDTLGPADPGLHPAPVATPGGAWTPSAHWRPVSPVHGGAPGGDFVNGTWVGTPYHYNAPGYVSVGADGSQFGYVGNNWVGYGTDPYVYHFGPGYHRHSNFGHYRFPYHSYRAPWYFKGAPSYNRDTNYPW